MTLVDPVYADNVKLPQANITYTEPKGFKRRGEIPNVVETKAVIAYDKKTKDGSYYFHIYYQNFSDRVESERGYKKMYKSSSEWSKNERFMIGKWELFYDQFFFKPSNDSNELNDRKRLFAYYHNQQAGLQLTITSTNTGSKEDLIKLFRAVNNSLSPKIGAEQDGADQPATAPESKPEGKEKPKPEAEGHSQ